MITVTLPDGRQMQVENGSTPADVAKAIGPGLAKAAMAARVDGRTTDLTSPLNDDAEISILTWNDEEGREVLRHTASHVLAQAVKRLWPEARLAIGPPIDDGFYYDIAFPEPINDDDLARIEQEMSKIVKENHASRRIEKRIDVARAEYASDNDRFKVELLDDLAREGERSVSVYEQGEFADLCRGPHLPSTGRIKAFKLLSLAGAYWRGDEKNEMLTRIYGTAFPDKKMLDEHLRLLEEARQRDHRKIGRELKLFSFHEEGPGFPFFHPNGVTLYNALIDECRKELRRRGYTEVKTPLILNEDLWHRSGHWDNYKENMYFTEIDSTAYAVKPMNCPGGLLMYGEDLYSYRDLPMRVAEFGMCHRHEKSGVLHGLFRVRTFTQDDAHHYCTEEQLKGEIRHIIEFVHYMYKLCGFEDFRMELSTRPEKSIGSDDIWEKATDALRETLEEMNLEYQLNPGDGAFYGPKIDFHILDSLKRSWQCGTCQVDFSMPERFDLSYVGEDGEKHRPVMVHRAIFGSIERFLGILTEHWAGDFPLWLAPVQAILLPMSADLLEYAQSVSNQLEDLGIRTEIDPSDEKIGKKIREAELRRVPLMLIVGKKEAEANKVSVRRRHLGDLGPTDLNEFIEKTREEIAARAKPPKSD